MPKRSYGIISQKKALYLLKKLIQAANLELAIPEGVEIEYRWCDTDAQHPKLVIQATLADLLTICLQDGAAVKVNKSMIREALHGLEVFLEILQDNRISTQGTATWHFTLNLWSRQTEQNLILAEQLWQERYTLMKQGLPLNHQPTSISSRALSEPQLTETTLLGDYLGRYQKHYGQIKVLPGFMKRPVLLETIYVDVKVLDERSEKILSSHVIEEFYHEFNRRSVTGRELIRQDGLALAQQNQYLMVLGMPGVGKTTFLKKLGLEAISRAQCQESIAIPVFIKLKHLKNEEPNFEKYIQAEMFPSEPSFDSQNYILRQLQQGKFLILLDGLDEVSADKLAAVVDYIQGFIRRFEKNRFVISCRTAAYSFNFTQFLDVIVAEFDDGQIQKFVYNWFDNDSEENKSRGRSFWKCLNGYGNASIKDLARTPIFLIYLCLLYEAENSLPRTRGHLCSKVLDFFLHDWIQQKNVVSICQDRLADMPLSLERKMLSDIAYKTFKNGHLFFSKAYLRREFDLFLSEKGFNQADIDGIRLLEGIEQCQGILAERFQDNFSFSHLILHEYLTAQYVVEEKIFGQLLPGCLEDRRWREVILLTSELLEDRALPFLQSLLERTNSQIRHSPKWHQVFSWMGNLAQDQNEDVALRQRASIFAAYSAIAAARASASKFDIQTAPHIASYLAKTCQSAVAIAKESSAIHQLAVMCSVAIAGARAMAVDEARAASIDQVIHGAQELITHISDDEGIIHNYDRAAVVYKVTQLAHRIVSLEQSSSGRFADTWHLLSASLYYKLRAIPDAQAATTAWLQWADALEACWVNALEMPPALLELTLVEAAELEAHLYFSELLVRCIEAAVYLPAETRLALKGHILL